MINSRKLDDLAPQVKDLCDQLRANCAIEGINILITSTYRDFECQDSLYAQGRTLPGKIVTNAKAGQSFHNWRVAFDIVPLVNGKPVWSTKGEALKTWLRVGEIGVSLGLEWAGNWKKFKEFPHFQFTNGLTLADFQSGKTL